MYTFLINLVIGLLHIINGKPVILNKEKLPKDTNYILAGPHRTILDPVMLAIAIYPQKVAFMAKKELFENRFLNWLFRSILVFPVDRDKPGTDSIRHAVNLLKEGDINFGLFPTGSRYSTEIKSGSSLIAKMANKPVVPMVYQGPLTVKGLFSWKKKNRVMVNIGDPIYLPDKKRLSKEEQDAFNHELKEAFSQLDHDLNPDYFYDVEAEIAKKQIRDAKKAKKNQDIS